MVERTRASKSQLKTKSSARAFGFVRTRHSPFPNLRPGVDMTQLSGSDFDEPLLPHHAHQPPPPPQFSSRTCLSALIIFFILLSFALLTSPLLMHALPRFLRPSPPSPNVGFSIVSACANRQPMLEKALHSWLSVSTADQIVIVDWSSSPPLLPIVQSVIQTSSSRTPVRVVRVDNESEWVLSRAYNLAIHHAAHESVFKVDCDYVLSPRAILAHDFNSSSKSFFAGFYENARSASEMHLNGALVISQSGFWEVGGYDERIQTYGFDDEELYKRLIAAGYQRLNVSFDEISHLDHEDSHRGQEGIRFPRVQIEVNKLLLGQIGIPWSRTLRASEYVVVNNDRNHLKPIYVPPDLSGLVSPEDRIKVQRLAYGRRLHEDYTVPWIVIASMDSRAQETVFGNLYERRNAVNFDEVVDKDINAPRFIIIHVQNGLGNRLRVLGSGLAFARRTKRVPILIWEADIHFGALFADLFDISAVNFGILHAFDAKWPLAERIAFDKAWGKVNFYNYMLSDGVGEIIPNDEAKNIYFKSSAIMNTSFTSWEAENAEIRKLVVRKDIADISERIIGTGMTKVGGVHIRNRSLDEDILGVEHNRQMYDKADAALLDKWRATSRVGNFIKEMKDLLNNKTVEKFFVASDTHKVCEFLEQSFPTGTVTYIPRNCDDRGAECDKFAMADLLVLSRVELLLGSTWSSFTEAAMRLGAPKAILAGTDFGVRP